jgi:L-alanine-DL-glutamate epimerase-like enolase superfamily enzyme
MAPHPQRLSVSRRTWPLAQPFAISRGSKTAAEVVVAEVSDGEFRGRGECVPYPRYGESVDSVVAALERHFAELTPILAELGVELIEQPLPAGDDQALAELPHPVPVCADESCHTSADLERLAGKYEAVNIKLDKTGGLTEALALAGAAEARGFSIMVGCMIGSSLAMAPAMLVAQRASVVDLDAPLLLAPDRQPGLRYEASTVYPPDPALWG